MLLGELYFNYEDTFPFHSLLFSTFSIFIFCVRQNVLYLVTFFGHLVFLCLLYCDTGSGFLGWLDVIWPNEGFFLGLDEHPFCYLEFRENSLGQF